MTTEELQLRRLVVCASGLVYWIGVVIQARRVRKQIGRAPNVKPRGAKEKALWVGWFVVIAAWVGQPWLVEISSGRPGVNLWPALVNKVSLIVGLLLVVFGYAGTLWAYSAMGDTWRMGINAKERTPLVCRGPYARIRHPIYGLQIVMLGGVALLLPTAVSFAALALHYLCVVVKLRDEEAYLATVHGEVYRDYSSRTGGLFPRWPRKHSTSPTAANPARPSRRE